MNQEIKIADQVDSIFKDITPTLISFAYKYKVPNPREVVGAWLSQAYIIADRFDKGELKKKVQNEEGVHHSSIEYDPAVHNTEDFIKTFKGYLKTSFKHDIIKDYHKKKRQTKYRNAAQSIIETTYNNQIEDIFDYEVIHIQDIMTLVAKDIERLEKSNSSILGKVNIKFLESIYRYCDATLKQYGNLVAVRDLEITNNKNFFTEDFREDLESGVRKELCKQILQIENPILIQKLSFLIPKDKRCTLQKRLFRYFFKYHTGYPKRLKNMMRNKP